MKILITLVLPLVLLGSAVIFASTPTKMTSHSRIAQSAREFGLRASLEAPASAKFVRQ
jgi:hypothetical protein